MSKNSLYEQLMTSEPMGLIDPLTDLGEFDFVQMKFKEPVRNLVNKYSGNPYSPSWQEKMDWNDYLKMTKEDTQKALDHSQELNEQQKNERTLFSQGSLQPEAEGSPTPVPVAGTFERSVTSRPTSSPHSLHFNINEGFRSRKKDSRNFITKPNLNKLNRRAEIIQKAAQYYLDELASSKVTYFTSNGTVAQVNFEEKYFMHLTGVHPLGKGQTPEKTLHDFAEGNGNFDNIILSDQNSVFKKINVLPDLEAALQTDSFYFDDLQDINHYRGRFDSLIKSDDKDIMLLFRNTDNAGTIPVSIWQARDIHKQELQQIDKNIILGIYRERDGVIEQIDINETYIHDGGKEMFSILKDKHYTAIEESRDALQKPQPSKNPTTPAQPKIIGQSPNIYGSSRKGPRM